MATIVFEVCMPARCWIAPEMPTAMYSCGETVLPVWPTWFWCGYQPASVAAREAPTAAPRESASFSTIEKLSALPMPRPPETTMEASASSGRPPLASTTLSTTFAPLAASDTETVRVSTSAAPVAASGGVEFGRTVMIGAPVATFDCTMVEPPKIDWVATKPSATPTASVMMPLPVLMAVRAATSLPSGLDATSTAAGHFSAISAASTSARGAAR